MQKEIEFKRASKVETTLEEYKTQREARMQENGNVQGAQIADRKSKIQKRIQELSSVKTSKENELKELLDTGLIDAEQVYVDEAHEVSELSGTEGALHEEE